VGGEGGGAGARRFAPREYVVELAVEMGMASAAIKEVTDARIAKDVVGMVLSCVGNSYREALFDHDLEKLDVEAVQQLLVEVAFLEKLTGGAFPEQTRAFVTPKAMLNSLLGEGERKSLQRDVEEAVKKADFVRQWFK